MSRRKKPAPVDPVKKATRDLLDEVFCHVERYSEGSTNTEQVDYDVKRIRRAALKLMRLARPRPRRR